MNWSSSMRARDARSRSAHASASSTSACSSSMRRRYSATARASSGGVRCRRGPSGVAAGQGDGVDLHVGVGDELARYSSPTQCGTVAERPPTRTVQTRPSRRQLGMAAVAGAATARARRSMPRRRAAATASARSSLARSASPGPAALVEDVGERGQRHGVPRCVTDRQLGDDGRLEVGDGEIEVAHRPGGERERTVRRPEAGHAEAGHHRQVGERREQRVRLAGGVDVAEQVGRLADAEHRRRPAARRQHRVQARPRAGRRARPRAVGLSPAAPASAATAATNPAAGSATVVESAISRTSGSSSSARPWSHRMEISCAPYQPSASASPTSRPSS